MKTGYGILKVQYQNHYIATACIEVHKLVDVAKRSTNAALFLAFVASIADSKLEKNIFPIFKNRSVALVTKQRPNLPDLAILVPPITDIKNPKCMRAHTHST